MVNLKEGQLMYFNELTQEWEPLVMGQLIEEDTMQELNDSMEHLKKALEECFPKITKEQAKRLLKYEKNPMARKQLNRIISSKR